MKKNNEVNLLDIINVKKESPFYSYIKITSFGIIWAATAYIAGVLSMNTSSHITTNIDNKDYIIVGTYSDKFILVGVDKYKKTTTNQVLLISNEKRMQLIRNNIGVINEKRINSGQNKR